MLLAHTVIIVTSELAKKISPDALDRALTQLTRMKKNPILVLGPDGDDILRTCHNVEMAEIVFDPNMSGDFSPIKAGLYATSEPAFVWNLVRDFPKPEVWQRLESALRLDEITDPSIDLVHVENDRSGLYLTTVNGTRRLKDRPAAADWPDAPDLKIKGLSFTSQTGA